MPHRPIPAYRRQKRPRGKDTAFVEVDGHRLYLGPYNSPESHEAYARLLVEMQEHGRQTTRASADITVVELVTAFWKHAEGY